MKTTVIAAVLLILLSASQCFASFRPAVIGGIRDGAALGLMLESGPTNNATLRLGFEANTGPTPGILFVGGKWLLSSIYSRYPMFISGGLVGYLGNNNSDAGPYISLIVERLFDVTPLFLEVGIDVVRSGRLQFQAGYYF